MVRFLFTTNVGDDRWSWTFGANGIFTTKCLSELIRSKINNSSSVGNATLRNIFVPKKVGIFIWRDLLGRIPVLSELDKRGIDLHFVRCPLCDDDIETVAHAVFHCQNNVEIWNRVFDWFGVSRVTLDFSNAFCGQTSLQFTEEGAKVWQAVEWTCGYLIWKNRNKKIFKKSSWNPPVALNEIQVKSFEWISKRCKTLEIDWHSWLTNPKKFIV
ncbi:uncharacterized protein [Rutidosis leptorrhynchoides]|uniref:uncharacterized protein n=1 Tax=Rutidosis leptorrhynchoides TaxID=125765 RepID=UPI003A9997FC